MKAEIKYGNIEMVIIIEAKRELCDWIQCPMLKDNPTKALHDCRLCPAYDDSKGYTSDEAQKWLKELKEKYEIGKDDNQGV